MALAICKGKWPALPLEVPRFCPCQRTKTQQEIQYSQKKKKKKIHVFGTNLCLALDTQPSGKAPVIAGGHFAFQGDIWQCGTQFWSHGGGGRIFVRMEVLSYYWHYNWYVMIVLSCKNKKPQIPVSIPVLFRFEQFIIYFQNLSQHLREIGSACYKNRHLLSSPVRTSTTVKN